MKLRCKTQRILEHCCHVRAVDGYACGLLVGRWGVAALGKTEFGLYGVGGGMMVITLLAFTMRQVRGRNATVSLSMGSDPMEAH